MKRWMKLAGFLLVALSLMACNLSSIAGNVIGGNAGTVNDLWPDVPKMDGMTKQNMDLPLAARVAIQAFFKAAGDNQGKIDFISYKSSHSVAEINAFYTKDRMKATGWNGSDDPGCTSNFGLNSSGDTATPTPSGSDTSVACFFTKNDSSTQGSFLAIFGTPDNSAKQVDLFFARIQYPLPTPTP